MDRRTRILAIAFGAAIICVGFAQLVYPTWIRPLFTLDERIAQRQEELTKLENTQRAIDDARLEYRDYVARIGSFDAGHVETSIRDRLNALIEKYKLENASVSPSRPVEDRKTGLTTTVINVGGAGTLESAIGFMKEIAEIPQLARLGNPAISPAGTGKKAEEQDRVNIRLPIEVLVLPKNQTVGVIEPATLPKSEIHVRHDLDRDYSVIWNRKPFIPYIEYPPLRVDVQKMVNVEVGQPAILQATASGGNQEYTFAWSPPDGLSETNQARVVVDSSTPKTQTYTVTVSDTLKDRVPVTATVAVNIREPKPPPPPTETQPQPPPPPPVVVDKSWPDANVMQIVMTLLRNSGGKRTNELMVHNNRTRETTYHKVTDEFDGGRLVFVHQTGGVVGKNKKYYVYPLGTMLSERLEYQSADSYPELKAAAERAVALETAQAQAKRNPAPIADPPPVKEQVELPTVDSRGGEESSPESASPVVEMKADGQEPVVPPAGEDSKEAEVAGSPNPSSAEPGTVTPPQDTSVQPDPKANPAKPAPAQGTRPRPPKTKRPGRV